MDGGVVTVLCLDTEANTNYWEAIDKFKVALQNCEAAGKTPLKWEISSSLNPFAVLDVYDEANNTIFNLPVEVEMTDEVKCNLLTN